MPNNSAADRPIICVFGSYAPQPDEPLYQQAYDIGYGLAKAGYDVCNGGYAGTMAASAKGAKDAGGSVIGVTCTFFKDATGQPLQPNPYIDREIPHNHLLRRIENMMLMSAGYVVLEGGTGTLAEFGIVWEYVCKRLTDPRPIFVVGDYWRPVVDRILAVRPNNGRHLHCVDTVDEIITIATREGIRPTPPEPSSADA
jgi:uncharacterized protein (TIGR00725 family)